MNQLVLDFLQANPRGFLLRFPEGRRSDQCIVDWYVRGDSLVYWILGDGGDDGRSHSFRVTASDWWHPGIVAHVSTSHGVIDLWPLDHHIEVDDELRQEIEQWQGRWPRGRAFGPLHGQVLAA